MELPKIEMPALKQGESAIAYRDIILMADAVKGIANRMLPTQAAWTHLNRCARVLKPFVDEYRDRRQMIQNAHAPDAGQVTEEGDKVSFKDAIGMTREFWELDRTLAVVALPSPITKAMLPVNSKAVPNNETGLGALTADLGPLYDVPDEDDSAPKAE